jgi:hypothetical protein
MPLSQPPRDAANEVIPHDHKEIEAQDIIIRRISTEHVVDDVKATSGRRVSKMAFRTSTDGNRGISIDLEKLIIEDGLRQVIPRQPLKWWHGLLRRSAPRNDGSLIEL